MADPFADASDVEVALLRPLTDLEAEYVPGLIDQACALLRNQAPAIDTRIARYQTDPTDPAGVNAAAVASVVAGVVKRYLVNPSGITSETDTAGPFSHSQSYVLRGEKETRGVLAFTADDLTVLFPNRRRNRAGTIRTRAGLAPRPVGRYGPIPDAAQSVGAQVVWSQEVSWSDVLPPVIGSAGLG